MTVTPRTERVPAAERIAVRCVDSDVHPVPRRGELAQYIPEPCRSKYFLDAQRRRADLLRRARLRARLRDARRHLPADGEFPGSDPDLAFRQLIMEAGSDIAILEPARLPGPPARGEPRDVRARSTTGRTTTGSTARTTGTSAGAARSAPRIEEPEAAAREIEQLGRPPVHGADPDQGRAAAVLGRPEVRPDLGGGHQARHPGELPPVPQPATTSCRCRRSGSPATTTTSWSPTRCWPRTR